MSISASGKRVIGGPWGEKYRQVVTGGTFNETVERKKKTKGKKRKMIYHRGW